MNHARAFDELDAFCEQHGLDCILVHEAALSAWGIDINLWLDCLDVLVRRRDLQTWRTLASSCDDASHTLQLANGMRLRVWTADDFGLDAGFASVGIGLAHVRGD